MSIYKYYYITIITKDKILKKDFYGIDIGEVIDVIFNSYLLNTSNSLAEIKKIKIKTYND